MAAEAVAPANGSAKHTPQIGLLGSDAEMRALALTYWANIIETGDRNLSAEDMARRGGQVNALASHQRAFVDRLRGLAVEEGSAP